MRVSKNQVPPQPRVQPAALTISFDRAAALFTEWERRYREAPEEFQSDVQRFGFTTPASYGESGAQYFFTLTQDVA